MLSLFYCPNIYICMSEYGNFIRRADLIKNLIERQQVDEMAKKPNRLILEANQKRWIQYQQLLTSELAAKIIAATGGGGKVLSGAAVDADAPSATPTFDADAQAFITAATITDPTQQTAINTLVVSMKGYGIWTKMKALYPMVGGTAAQHKFNLKNPLDTDAAFRLVFNGGWTHSSTGALPNGTNAFADTKLRPSSNSSLNSAHFSYYSRTLGALGYALGASDLSQTNRTLLQLDTGNYYGAVFTSPGGYFYYGPGNSLGLLNVNRNASNVSNMWQRDVKKISDTTAPAALTTNSIYFGAGNANGTPGSYFNGQCAFGSIGDGLTDAEAINYYTAVQTFQTTLGRHVGVPIVSDSDAQAFLNAAVIEDSTQASAVNTLVTDLKSYGVWTKMKALYPFVGGTATTHKFNLKNPLDTNAAFRLVFNGGWTHSTTGALPNGTNGYANTFFLPGSGFSSSTSRHLSFYLRTNNIGGGDPVDMGVIHNGSPTHDPAVPTGNDYLLNGNSNLFKGQSTSIDVSTPTTDRRGLSLISKTSINQSLFKNGIIKATSSGTGAYTELYPIYIGGLNISNNFFPYGPTNNEFSIASIGDGLTDTEAANYYTAVEKFQTTLGRNTTVPTVSDADAQAFLNAAYITNTTQATAVNTLVTSLKGYGIWTKMKALYPFVGGTATTHKFNLKNPLDTDAAFRLTFNGGWTHSITGAKPNGTNAYANTFLIPNTSLQLNSAHISFYSRTNTASWCDIGSSNASLQNGVYMLNNCPGNINYSSFFFGGSNYVGSGYTRGDGFFSLRRNNSTQYISSRNSVNTTYAFNTVSKTTFPIYISSLNNGGTNVDYSVRECAIASIGDGLDDTEWTNYYTAVQAFQTTLGRNI